MAIESRIICESGQEARLASLIEPIIESLDMCLVQVRLLQHNGLTLQVMAERPDGTMSIDDCELLSRSLSSVLDIEDPLPGGYMLEVSSPGLDRPLVRQCDFEKYLGYRVKLDIKGKISGKSSFKGILLSFTEEEIVLRTPGDDIAIPVSALHRARLLSDESMIKESLRRDKMIRKGVDIMESNYG